MHRSLIPAVALALGVIACHPHGLPAAGTPVDHHPVVAGESNRFFVATSEQSFAIAADVRSTPVKDRAGHQKGFRLIARDASAVTVTCECPASCSAGGHGPVSAGCWTLGESVDAPHCWAACGGADESCASCVLVSWDRDAAGAVEEHGAITIAEANGRKEATR